MPFAENWRNRIFTSFLHHLVTFRQRWHLFVIMTGWLAYRWKHMIHINHYLSNARIAEMRARAESYQKNYTIVVSRIFGHFSIGTKIHICSHRSSRRSMTLRPSPSLCVFISFNIFAHGVYETFVKVIIIIPKLLCICLFLLFLYEMPQERKANVHNSGNFIKL